MLMLCTNCTKFTSLMVQIVPSCNLTGELYQVEEPLYRMVLKPLMPPSWYKTIITPQNNTTRQGVVSLCFDWIWIYYHYIKPCSNVNKKSRLFSSFFEFIWRLFLLREHVLILSLPLGVIGVTQIGLVSEAFLGHSGVCWMGIWQIHPSIPSPTYVSHPSYVISISFFFLIF